MSTPKPTLAVPGTTPTIFDVDEWDAVTCLHWLADHTTAPNHFRERADDWPAEVHRCALHERISDREYEEMAVEELRNGVRDQWPALACPRFVSWRIEKRHGRLIRERCGGSLRVYRAVERSAPLLGVTDTGALSAGLEIEGAEVEEYIACDECGERANPADLENS